MRRILEYRVFDILKDPENAKFLFKVKKENPDLYVRFLNIVGNKGLETAKERYVEFDPEEVRKRKEEEETDNKEREKLKKERESLRKHTELYKKNEKEIKELEGLIDNTELKIIANKIKTTPELDILFKKLKKQYVGEIRKKLRNLNDLDFELEFYDWDFVIDSLTYYRGYNRNRIIYIAQHYNMKTEKLYYNIRFTAPILKYDIVDFGVHVSDYINKLSKMNIDKGELYEILFVKLPKVFSEEYYKEWKKQYDLEQDVSKYNL